MSKSKMYPRRMQTLSRLNIAQVHDRKHRKKEPCRIGSKRHSVTTVIPVAK